MSARRGFVLIWLVAVLATVALTLLAGIPSLYGGGARGPHARAERGVAEIAFGAHEAWLQDSGFPADLATLVTKPVASTDQLTTGDPFDLAGATLDYALAGGDLDLASRGPDRILGTADDLTGRVPGQTPGRNLSRNRLRILRAEYTTTVYVDDPDVTPADRATLLQALRDATVARRHVVYASGAQKTQLQQEVSDNEAIVVAILTAAGAPAPPAQVTGPGGLLAAMGLPDSLGTDGFGNTMYVGVPGFLSAGANATQGDDDDL